MAAKGVMGQFAAHVMSLDGYKSGQGQIVRRATLITLAAFVGWGAMSWYNATNETDVYWYRLGVPLLVGGLLAWVCYRITEFPPFADFLIATEAEMNKVNWPTFAEIKAATAVVLITLVLMMIFLFIADQMWQWLLFMIGVLQIYLGVPVG